MKAYMGTMIFSALVALVALTAAPASAQVPQLINYQGRISDTSCLAIDTTITMTFRIYDAAVAGTTLWTEAQTVTVQKGIFNILLGSVTPFPVNLFSTSPRYLGVTLGAGSELTPRSQFVSVPYALNTESAQNAVSADHASRADTALRAWFADTATTADTAHRSGLADTATVALKVVGGGGSGLYHLYYHDSTVVNSPTFSCPPAPSVTFQVLRTLTIPAGQFQRYFKIETVGHAVHSVGTWLRLVPFVRLNGTLLRQAGGASQLDSRGHGDQSASQTIYASFDAGEVNLNAPISVSIEARGNSLTTSSASGAYGLIGVDVTGE